jgi:hypothetical protein
MEENQVSIGKISIRYGLISGLLAIAFMVVVDLAGMTGNSTVQYLWYLVLAGIIFMAHKSYKEEGDGFMNYGQGIGIGALLSLISSIISSVFFYIYVSFINTEYMTTIMDIQRAKMEEQGMADAQIEQAMEMTAKFMSPVMMVVFGIIATVFFGVIISLIVSAITQKKRPENLMA